MLIVRKIIGKLMILWQQSVRIDGLIVIERLTVVCVLVQIFVLCGSHRVTKRQLVVV